MRTHLVCLGLLLAVTIPASAQADSTTNCPFMQDAAGDQTALPGYTSQPDTTPGAASLDLRSADITADSKNLSAVVRVINLRDADPVYVGHVYDFTFSTESTQFNLSADLSSDGNDFTISSGAASPTGSATSLSVIGPITGIVDAHRNEIRMIVPRSLLRRSGAAGAVGNFTVYAGREVQTVETHGPVLFARHSGFVNNEDQMSTDRFYRIGDRGCGAVRP